jgi:hypothetical protein
MAILHMTQQIQRRAGSYDAVLGNGHARRRWLDTCQLTESKNQQED